MNKKQFNEYFYEWYKNHALISSDGNRGMECDDDDLIGWLLKNKIEIIKLLNIKIEEKN